MGIVLTLNKIECAQDGSCENAVFVTGEYVTIREANCATDACYGCLIKEKLTDVGRPCDPEFFSRPTPPPTNPVTTAPVVVTPAPVDPQYVTTPVGGVAPAIPAIPRPA